MAAVPGTGTGVYSILLPDASECTCMFVSLHIKFPTFVSKVSNRLSAKFSNLLSSSTVALHIFGQTTGLRPGLL